MLESTIGDDDPASRAAEVGQALADSLQGLMDALPGAPHRPSTLARRLGLSRVILSRTLNALSRSSSIELLCDIPGPESLRAIVRAAAERGLGREIVEATDAAIDEFDRLIREDFGTRAALEALVSASLPQAREKFDAASRYEAFNSTSCLLGVQADAWVTSMLIHPSAGAADQLDVAAIHGALGLRRLRLDANVYFRFGTGTAVHKPAELESFELHRYYSNPPALLRNEVCGDEMVHVLETQQVGRQALVDVLVADYRRNAMPRYSQRTARNKRGASVLPDVPVKVLAFDLLLHPNVFPGSDPRVLVYNTCLRGPANINDPRRDLDRMHGHYEATPLGPGVSSFHSPDVPNYVPMLREMCERLGWDPTIFRAYRCRVQYPVYGWQIFMAFDGPLPPEQPGGS